MNNSQSESESVLGWQLNMFEDRKIECFNISLLKYQIINHIEK